MPGCVGVCTWVWNESNGSWDPGGYNTCESGCMCGPAPGQEGPYDGYVATVACEGTPGSTTTTSSSSSSSTTSSTTTSSTTSSTTTSTTTTSAPCEGICTYSWLPVGAGYQWVLQYSTCTAPGCYCNPPGYSGSYYGQEGFGFCRDTSPTTTTTTTTSTSTSTTSTAPPTTTTTTTGTGTTTSSTTTTTTTEQPCTGTCTWRWHAELQKWLKVSGGNGTCSTGCSCSYPAADGTTDGETATPACKRLTCTKCCGVDDCCPAQICCNGTITTIPRRIYFSFVGDPAKCIDGFSMYIDLAQYTKQVDYPFIGYTTHTWTWSIHPSLSQRIASCDGKATAYPNWSTLRCTGTPMGCNGDVYAKPNYSIQIVYDNTNSLYACLRQIRLDLGAAAFIPFTNTCRDFLPNGLGQYATTGAHIGDNCSVNPFIETYSNLDFSCVDSVVPNQSYTFDLGVFDMVLSS